jgi:hypothetical protein
VRAQALVGKPVAGFALRPTTKWNVTGVVLNNDTLAAIEVINKLDGVVKSGHLNEGRGMDYERKKVRGK